MIISYIFLLTKLPCSRQDTQYTDNTRSSGFTAFWAQCAENGHAWCCGASKDNTALAGGVKRALRLPKLAELCCHKQGACKSPGGISVSETMAFSIFLTRKHILKGNHTEIEIFKVKPYFHTSQWDSWHRLLKNQNYTLNSLFMRNKWYFNIPVFFHCFRKIINNWRNLKKFKILKNV